MGVHQRNLKDLFQGVFWPAAAGNVFWSACSLAVDPNVALLSHEVLSRLAVLLVLSVYLSVEWLRNYGRFPSTVPWKFWLADWLHVCAVVFVALTAALRADWLVFAAGAYFAITAFGHFFGAWEASDASGADRAILGFINLLGVVCIVVGETQCATWHIATAFLLVVGLWAGYRRKDLRSLFMA